MKEAAVAIEDQRFYEHSGVDFRGIARAVWQDVTSGGAAQGASTITQQFVKNALEAQQSRTVFQKLREAALAYHLERQWSKDKILTEYLNSIYFGEGAYGIESAARTFFGYNHPGCGQDGESAVRIRAAALGGGPAGRRDQLAEVNSPRSQPRRRQGTAATSCSRRWREQGDITDEEYAALRPAAAADAAADPAADATTSKAPYFTSWLRQQLVDKYGAGEAFGGGLTVKSTLDLDLQEQVEAIAASRSRGVGLDTSVVVIDNQTGGVRAMVGGDDYNKAPFNLATNGHRQPGSSFKPFTLITALKQGHSTDEVYTSGPKEFPFKAKIPKKKGNGRRSSTTSSSRPTTRATTSGSASIATRDDLLRQLRLRRARPPGRPGERGRRPPNDLGIETDLSSDTRYSIDGKPFEPYNPALILGGLDRGRDATGDGPRLRDGGRGRQPDLGHDGRRAGRAQRDHQGDQRGRRSDVEDKTGASGVNEVTKKQELDPEVAATARDVLTTVVTSGTGKRAQTSEPTWGKTGTTDDNGDAWFVGATPDITVAIWVGHADSRDADGNRVRRRPRRRRHDPRPDLRRRRQCLPQRDVRA